LIWNFSDSIAIMDEMRDGRRIDSGMFKCFFVMALCDGMGMGNQGPGQHSYSIICGQRDFRNM
jgi:hypothetical protein